jgi:mevalonate kinase
MTTQRVTNGLPNGHAGEEADGPSANGITNGIDSIKVNPRKKMDRKKSSPMLPAFMVSAPGKVIVFGEHAVVHGKVSAH